QIADGGVGKISAQITRNVLTAFEFLRQVHFSMDQIIEASPADDLAAEVDGSWIFEVRRPDAVVIDQRRSGMVYFDPHVAAADDEFIAMMPPYMFSNEDEGLPKQIPRSQLMIRLRSATTSSLATQMKIAPRPPPFLPRIPVKMLSEIVQFLRCIMSMPLT